MPFRRQLSTFVQCLIVLLLAAVTMGCAFGQGPLSPIVANHFLVAYRDGRIPDDAEANTQLAGGRIVKQHARLGIAVVQGNGTASEAASLKRLAAQPNVDFVVHDRMVYAHRVEPRPMRPVSAPGVASGTMLAIGDAFYRSPQGWAVRQVGGYGKGVPGGPAHGPWDVTTGAGVRIAVLDSGIDAHHPDLEPNLTLSLSEIDQTPMSGLPSACDDGTPQDQQGHGTWVASLAAGALGQTTGEVAGVAPSASLLNIKVLQRMP